MPTKESEVSAYEILIWHKFSTGKMQKKKRCYLRFFELFPEIMRNSTIISSFLKGRVGFGRTLSIVSNIFEGMSNDQAASCRYLDLRPAFSKMGS